MLPALHGLKDTRCSLRSADEVEAGGDDMGWSAPSGQLLAEGHLVKVEGSVQTVLIHLKLMTNVVYLSLSWMKHNQKITVRVFDSIFTAGLVPLEVEETQNSKRPWFGLLGFEQRIFGLPVHAVFKSKQARTIEALLSSLFTRHRQIDYSQFIIFSKRRWNRSSDHFSKYVISSLTD